MVDVGLLVSGVAMWAVVAFAARWAPVSSLQRGEVVDRMAGPVVVGLLAGRLAAVLLDDRASLGSLRSMLVIRGGVEFWPGAVAMVALLAWTLRRRHAEVMVVLSELAPFALWGYATYEAACLVREGCYGPTSPVGLVPDGLQTRMLPVGLLVAAAVTGTGLAVRRLRAWTPAGRLLLAAGGLAAVRGLAAVGLPHLGAGPSRQQVESTIIAAGVGLAALGRRGIGRGHRHPDEPWTEEAAA